MRQGLFAVSYGVYCLLWCILCIPSLFTILWRYRQYPEHTKRWSERFGLATYDCNRNETRTKVSTNTEKLDKQVLWLHLSSVGEVLSCKPLVQSLLDKSIKLVLTTTTPTGAELIQKTFTDDDNEQLVIHYYLPFDLPWAMSRFLRQVRPCCGVLYETEIWPALLLKAQQLAIPMLLINGRLSERSYQGYQRFAFFFTSVFASFTAVCAQSQQDQRHFSALGADPVKLTGNIKADIWISREQRQAANFLKQQWSLKQTRQIVLVASTHADEEIFILDAWQRLLSTLDRYHRLPLLVMAPRHADRFDAVASLCEQTGLITLRRSTAKPVTEHTAIVLVDTLGELLMLLGTANIAIMGGTFIERGGHNFLEPAAWALPIISGYSVYNFPVIAQALTQTHALVQVDSSEALQLLLNQYLTDADVLKERGRAAYQYLQENTGALALTLEQIFLLMDAQS